MQRLITPTIRENLMTIDVNKKIFDLVPLVTEKPEAQKPSMPFKELIGIPIIINLGKVENIKESQSDLDGKTVNAFKNSLGLSNINYSKLTNISNEILQQSPYNGNTTIEFIEEHLFDWIIETYKNKKTLIEPLNYLQTKFEEEFDEYTYYFRIHALGIESPFQIGNVQIMFFSEEILEELYSLFKLSQENKTKEEFDAFFKPFEGRPIAKVQTKGTKNKSKLKGQKQVNTAIDILKAFLVEESVRPSTQLMDVEYRFKHLFPHSYIYETCSEKFDFHHTLERIGGIEPVELYDQRLKHLLNSGLDKVSDFAFSGANDELAILIQRAIKKIGEYSSEDDLHERVIKIISLYEFLFIPVTKGKGRGQTIVKSNVLKKIIEPSEQEEIIRIFNTFYDIRDKMLHNGIEKHIDLNNLYKVQKITLFLLKYLVELNKKLKTKIQLYNYFKIKSGSN
ncbi:hypothetical protein [Aegicerativicinus sediminis]|uniref:hypothetical protein n=1 Tax=Aegicerativicinus sediminis TaxID=2893202 RepID=UPI001E4FC356|nr:hypothetical protein [Aegicerativicinus sediminis]